MNSTDSTNALREALGYLSGIEACAHLDPEQRTQHALTKLTTAISTLLDEVAEIRRRVESLEARTETNGISAAPMEEPAEAAADQASRELRCPSCGRRLPISHDLWQRDTFEISCPHCALTVEVR